MLTGLLMSHNGKIVDYRFRVEGQVTKGAGIFAVYITRARGHFNPKNIMMNLWNDKGMPPLQSFIIANQSKERKWIVYWRRRLRRNTIDKLASALVRSKGAINGKVHKWVFGF